MINERTDKYSAKHRQLLESYLSASVKEVKSELKQVTLQSRSSLWLQIEDEISIDQQALSHRLTKHERLLAYCQEELKGYEWFSASLQLSPLNKHGGLSIGSHVITLKKKKAILEKLVSTLRDAIIFGSVRDIFDVYKLEQELILTTDYDSLDFYPASYALVRKKKALTETLKKLRSRLRFIIKYKAVKQLRDLRQFFRSLVHQIFKNMSDVSGERDVLLMHLTRQLFLNTSVNLITHGHTRCQTTTIINT
jgi:hypothetical protein